mgnify:CR=1 FL=1
MYNQEELKKYLQYMNQESNPLFLAMEAYAAENKIPIMEKEALDVMLQLLQLHNSKRILEIGTAIGYSALKMASALPDAHVVSLERDAARYEKAQEFRHQTSLSNQTTFYLTDTLKTELIFENNQEFDVLFIDAAKGKNKEFLTKYLPLLTENALVITDNVFFKGMVAGGVEIPKRFLPMVRKLRDYNEWLRNHEEFQTRFLAVGDGIAVSKKI